VGTFNMGNDKYGTCKMGYMIPIQLQKVLPGDVWKCKTRALLRLAPMVAPQFSKVKVRIHHWFVPTRLVWTDFPSFITGGEDGMNATVAPYFNITESQGQSTAMDYLGIPEAVAAGTHISAVPMRGYQLIKKLFYRDQDLETAPTISLGNGEDTTTTKSLQRFCWDKDIFTTARPWTMKGPDVTIPISGGLGGSAPVLGIGKQDDSFLESSVTARESDGTTSVYATASKIDPSVSTKNFYVEQESTSGFPNIHADLESSDVETDDLYVQIPDLRLAAAMARYEENRGRFGGNYVDYLNFLGVNYSDKTLQRPEYLGGDQGVIQFSEVLQTSAPDADEGEGVGTMVGHGISAFGKGGFKYRAEEHGFIYTIMMIAPDSQYGNGIVRDHYSEFTKEDYWQRELEHIGQQMVQNKELYAASASMYDPEGEWGWVDRYEHYRTAAHHQSVCGEFRDSLAFWHMVRLADLDSPVPFVLNDSFVQCQPTDRIYQATWEDQVWFKIDNRAKARRLVTANAKPILF